MNCLVRHPGAASAAALAVTAVSGFGLVSPAAFTISPRAVMTQMVPALMAASIQGMTSSSI